MRLLESVPAKSQEQTWEASQAQYVGKDPAEEAFTGHSPSSPFHPPRNVSPHAPFTTLIFRSCYFGTSRSLPPWGNILWGPQSRSWMLPLLIWITVFNSEKKKQNKAGQQCAFSGIFSLALIWILGQMVRGEQKSHLTLVRLTLPLSKCHLASTGWGRRNEQEGTNEDTWTPASLQRDSPASSPTHPVPVQDCWGPWGNDVPSRRRGPLPGCHT